MDRKAHRLSSLSNLHVRANYERYGQSSVFCRELVACKHCPDTHLLSPYQAASFGFLGDPIDGPAWTRSGLALERWFGRDVFDRRKFPPVADVKEPA